MSIIFSTMMAHIRICAKYLNNECRAQWVDGLGLFGEQGSYEPDQIR